MIRKLFQRAEEQGYVAVRPDALRIGMYVWLKCTWYKHPFPTNRFLLTSEKQIETIRTLKLTSIYIHPGLSREEDKVPPPTVAAPTPPARQVNPLPPTAAQISKERLTAANHRYADTLRQGAGALRQIIDGHTEGIRATESIVQGFLEQIETTEATLGLAHIMHLKSMNRAQAAHGLNTAILALLVGQDLDLTPQELKILGLAGLLHDIGETRLPSKVRYTDHPLTRYELELFQRHPLYGEEMLRNVAGVDANVLAVIVQHHEHLDGSGFPRGLTAPDMLPLAKILRVVDEYWTLVNPAGGGPGLPPNQALSELYTARQHQLWDKVLTALVRVVSVYPPGTLVELSNRRIGMVIGTNPGNRLRPVLMMYGTDDRHPSPTEIVDLDAQPDVTIVRALRSADLPPHIAATVDPQEMLTYLLCQPLSSLHQPAVPPSTNGASHEETHDG